MICCSVFFIACKKDIKDIGAVQSQVDGIKGSWEVVKIVMNDSTATTPDPIEVTDYFQASTKMPNINFNTTDNSYTSDVNGVAYDFFGTSGKWAFDNAQFPKTITFTPTGGTAITMGMMAPIRLVDAQLKIQKYMYCDSAQTNFKYAYQIVLERR
jgi:hypothetical protein